MPTISIMVDAKTGKSFSIDEDSIRFERDAETGELKVSAQVSGDVDEARTYLKGLLDNKVAEIKRLI